MRKLKFNYNQLTLPFDSIRSIRVGFISYDYRVRTFWALVAVSLVSLGAYIYAINATARHIANRQNLERQIAERSRTLDSLEFTYIGLKNNVTIDLAYEKGFREEKSPLFVSRSRTAALSFNTVNRE